ncbi:hypothetical protein AAFF_G00150350 [Aldrovandia affinis]|uniref:Uncharacterized protein n=1 Tax=Aldrovandia affinis TaxID=143900 RepID=A0AAD7W9E5_9TELE|nr:hypothetical protein AAFF_G00150350 [Aldrovandia affinis]
MPLRVPRVRIVSTTVRHLSLAGATGAWHPGERVAAGGTDGPASRLPLDLHGLRCNQNIAQNITGRAWGDGERKSRQRERSFTVKTDRRTHLWKLNRCPPQPHFQFLSGSTLRKDGRDRTAASIGIAGPLKTLAFGEGGTVASVLRDRYVPEGLRMKQAR